MNFFESKSVCWSKKYMDSIEFEIFYRILTFFDRKNRYWLEKNSFLEIGFLKFWSIYCVISIFRFQSATAWGLNIDFDKDRLLGLKNALKLVNFSLVRLHHLKFSSPTVWGLNTNSGKDRPGRLWKSLETRPCRIMTGASNSEK